MFEAIEFGAQGMTSYQMLDLANSHIANTTADLNRLAAVCSAYLIVAYRVGRELNRFQVGVINIFFLVIAVQAGVGAAGEHAMAIGYWKAVFGPEAASQNEIWNLVGYVLLVIGLGVCLAFMWGIRRPDSERQLRT